MLKQFLQLGKLFVVGFVTSFGCCPTFGEEMGNGSQYRRYLTHALQPKVSQKPND
jgi:hypothetical protein